MSGTKVQQDLPSGKYQDHNDVKQLVEQVAVPPLPPPPFTINTVAAGQQGQALGGPLRPQGPDVFSWKNKNPTQPPQAEISQKTQVWKRCG